MPNLVQGRRFRPKLAEGDLFRMRHIDGGFLFGRVVIANAPERCGPMPGASLLYYYAGVRERSEPEPSSLDYRQLLIPPTWTNNLAWRHGYYETIRRDPLRNEDRWVRHAFGSRRGRDGERMVYVDECGMPCEVVPGQPPGRWALTSYRAIDDEISDALGTLRASLSTAEAQELDRYGRCDPMKLARYRSRDIAQR